jgi:integrase
MTAVPIPRREGTGEGVGGPNRPRHGLPAPGEDTSRHVPVTAGEHALTEPEVRLVLERAADFECEVLLRVAIATGIRREDLVRIRLEGVDLEATRIRYYESKKKRWRDVDLGGETLSALRKWVAGLPGASPWLFPSSFGPKGRKSGHRSGRWAYNVLQGALRSAGLEERPFHSLRATCVKLCQVRGWSAEATSRLTGDTIRVIQLHYSTPSRDEMSRLARERPLL